MSRVLAEVALTSHRDVVSIQKEAECLLEVLTECVEVRSRYLDRLAAHLAREVSVHRAREVVHGGVLIEVGVHHNLQRFKLLQDSVDRRRADVGLTLLHFLGNFVSRQMSGGAHEHFGDRSLGHGRPFRGTANGRDDLVDLSGVLGHSQRLRPGLDARYDSEALNCGHLVGVQFSDDPFGLFHNG